MSDTSQKSTNLTTQQNISPITDTTQTNLIPTTKDTASLLANTQSSTASVQKNLPTSKPNEPRDDLAVAGGFLAVGLYLSYIPTDAHIPSFQGFFQFLAYCCYAVGFLGGMFGLSKLSKNLFFETFGLGFFLGVLAYGIHWMADLLQWIPVVSISLRLLILVPIGFAGYGMIRGISYFLIKENVTPTQPKEPMNPEQVAGIIIAVLSVVTAVMQSLPSLLPTIKQLFHIP